jgi:hypothetical protein
MRVTVYVLFNIGAILSNLVTCHILKDAIELRELTDGYLHGEINLARLIVTLDEVLSTLDPEIRLSDFEYSSYLMRFAALKVNLEDREDGTHSLRIIHQTTIAIWEKLGSHILLAENKLRESKSDDTKLGLCDQPIVKALNVRFAVEALIAGRIKTNDREARLSNVLKSIYPEDIPKDKTSDITDEESTDITEEKTTDIAEDKPCDIKTWCSSIILNHSLDLTGPDSKRIPYESVVALLDFLNYEPDAAREKLEESKSKDNDFEFTEELNKWSRATGGE